MMMRGKVYKLTVSRNCVSLHLKFFSILREPTADRQCRTWAATKKTTSIYCQLSFTDLEVRWEIKVELRNKLWTQAACFGKIRAAFALLFQEASTIKRNDLVLLSCRSNCSLYNRLSDTQFREQNEDFQDHCRGSDRGCVLPTTSLSSVTMSLLSLATSCPRLTPLPTEVKSSSYSLILDGPRAGRLFLRHPSRATRASPRAWRASVTTGTSSHPDSGLCRRRNTAAGSMALTAPLARAMRACLSTIGRAS